MQATLKLTAVDAVPIWTEWTEGYGDLWNHFDPPHDAERWDGERGEWIDADGDPCPDGYGDGPMMNYRYTLPHFDGDPYEAQVTLDGLPLCIVEYCGDYCLALTGGGMDLSWEICTAYIRLGYLPPAHFCSDLPKYAGHNPGDSVLAACRESLAIMAQRAEGRLARFDADWS